MWDTKKIKNIKMVKFMRDIIIIRFKQIRVVILLTILFLFFTLNLFAQDKEYRYQFKHPSIDCYYYYIQSESSTSLNNNDSISLVVRILDRNKNLDTDIIEFMQLIVGERDTILFLYELSENNEVKIKIPRLSSFCFNVCGMFTCSNFTNKRVNIDNENINEVLLTIVQGNSGFGHYHIISKKRELKRGELQDICDDIIYGTKKSKLKQGKDYYVMTQL